jgi:methanogenic corrinoid protein MtbC1
MNQASQVSVRDTRLTPLQKYLDAVLRPDPARARAEIEQLVRGGMDPRAIYLEVLAPAQAEVGRRWANGEVSVAAEHMASTVTRSIMSALAPRMRRQAPRRMRVVLACTESELHSIGTEMLADFLHSDGWEVFNLGARTPLEHLVAFVQEHSPAVVGLSSSLEAHQEEVVATISALKALEPAPLVMVGGSLYDGDRAFALSLGADAFARDAGEAQAFLASRFAECSARSARLQGRHL